MSPSLAVRPARVEDVAQMARVNVRCWQETYRGLMPDTVLDDPDFLSARERFWTAALTDDRYRGNRVAVAERDGELIGIAMSGPALDAEAAWARQLYVLYVQAADHGTGAGPALLAAVVDPEQSVALWVADPNPRAQAFYRKHGFVADGATQVEGGVREIRMVRPIERHQPQGDRGRVALLPISISATMGGMEERVSIDVAAPADRVWEVLVDVERWPEWTDSVSSVRPLDAAPLAVGSRVEISQPRIPTGTYTVTALEPGRAFTWEQRQPGSTVSAHHECARLAAGGTRVELRVVMSGAVGGVVGRLYRKLTARYLAMEAAGLKARAENLAR